MNEFWIVILTSSVVTAFINIIWKYIEKKIAFKNAKYMQITNYYREMSSEDMHRILGEWTDMLFFIDNPKVEEKMEDESYLKTLLNDTYLYSSPETCSRLAKFQQYNYINHNTESNRGLVTLVLVAGIIVSLKHDFTGDWVSIEETLKIKLNDFEEGKGKIKQEINRRGY